MSFPFYYALNRRKKEKFKYEEKSRRIGGFKLLTQEHTFAIMYPESFTEYMRRGHTAFLCWRKSAKSPLLAHTNRLSKLWAIKVLKYLLALMGIFNRRVYWFRLVYTASKS